MYKSAQRRKVESALQAATDPATIAALSAELTALSRLEERRRARRAKAAKAAKNDVWDEVARLEEEEEEPFDPDATIELPSYTPPEPHNPPRLDLSNPVHRDTVGLREPEPEPPAPQMSDAEWRHLQMIFGRPERVAVNDWCPADGFSFTAVDDYGRPYETNERQYKETKHR